jgi:hypothetical protein
MFCQSNYGIKSFMIKASTFYPPKKAGVFFHITSIVLLITGGSIGLFSLSSTRIGFLFFSYVFIILAALVFVPILIYRLSYLQNAVYILERDSLRLQWGLRIEVIPTSTILWVQRASELEEPIHLPWIRWPGAVLGVRRIGVDMIVEFMASKSQDLILVATYERVYAISPNDPVDFLEAYQGLTELGSLIETQYQSENPTSLLADVWNHSLSRNLIISSISLSVILFIWVVSIAPGNAGLFQFFHQSGVQTIYTPPIHIIAFPWLNILFLFVNLFVGLMLFRREKYRPLAFLLWVNCVLVALLFLIAVLITTSQ